MSAPTNPERLWCFLVRNGHIVCQTEGHARLVHDNNFKRLDGEGLVSPVAEYVLASVARSEADEMFERGRADALSDVVGNLAGDRLDALNEAAALRRERDALAARVEKLRATLAYIEHVTRKSVDRSDVWDAAGEALLGDDAAAKEVG